MRAAIVFCREEQIRQLIEYLGSAAEVTDESLRQDFLIRHALGGWSTVH